MNVCSDFAVPAFGRHLTIYFVGLLGIFDYETCKYTGELNTGKDIHI
jgi:hypothetical protein